MGFSGEDMLLAAYGDVHEMESSRVYVIACLCTCGARFYSQEFARLADARDELHMYCSTVEYFGGGDVGLYEIKPEEGDFQIIDMIAVA